MQVTCAGPPPASAAGPDRPGPRPSTRGGPFMRERYFRACVAAAAGGTVAVVCLAPAAATAAVTGHGPHRDTPQCLAYNSGGPVHSLTWAQDSGGSPGLRITATGGYVNAPVIMTQADHSDPM